MNANAQLAKKREYDPQEHGRRLRAVREFFIATRLSAKPEEAARVGFHRQRLLKMTTEELLDLLIIARRSGLI